MSIFKVGNIVKFKNSDEKDARYFKRGLENLEVKIVCEDGRHFIYESDKSTSWYVDEDELEFQISKFKVGDKVRAKADCYNDISECEAIVDKIVSSSEGHILNMVLFITKCSAYYSVGSYTSNSSWQRDIELITDTPKEKLIETDMDTEDIKNFPKAVLVKAEKEAKKELANEQEEIAVAKFKELFGRIADKERELSRVQSELKDLRGEAKITNK